MLLFSEWKKIYIEKKDHIIKKIPNLSNEQKIEIIDFFNNHRNLENKIDWNNWKELTYDDFSKILSMDSKTQKWKRVKEEGLEGLRKGKDYIDFGMFEGYRALAPLTYEASKLIASKYIGNCVGKWCTAYQKTDEHWIDYTDRGMAFVYFVKKGDKIALAYHSLDEIEVFDKEDNKLSDFPIDIYEFIKNNEDKLDSLSEKILDSEEKEYRQMRKDFLEAIIKNNISKVRELIKKGVDPSVDDNYAIRMASKNGHLEIVKLLLNDKRIDPSVDDNYAIRMASKNNHIEVVKLLLKDERVNPGVNNNYAIRMASKNGQIEIVKLLLNDKRVDPSVSNNSAIRIASENGYTEIVKLLLKDERVDPSADYNDAIKWASYYGHKEIIKLLLKDNRVDPSDGNNYAIRMASKNGHLEIVKLLLQDNRVDPSVDDNYAIRMASRYGYIEIVKFLLKDERVDPSVDDNFAIQVASKNGHIEVVKLLLQDKRVDPSDSNNYAIQMASYNGYTKILKLLLQDKRVKDSLSKEDYDKYYKEVYKERRE